MIDHKLFAVALTRITPEVTAAVDSRWQANRSAPPAGAIVVWARQAEPCM